MRSDRYHEIFGQKTPSFYDTAISSIAVAHRRYCQEDLYYSVSSVNSWRTRCHFQEDLYILLYYHQLIAGAHDVLTSNNNSNSQ